MTPNDRKAVERMQITGQSHKDAMADVVCEENEKRRSIWDRITTVKKESHK